jgi:hypothetical protein
MKRGKIFSVIMVLAFLAAVASKGQSVPQFISYQGRLTDNAGLPLDGVNVDLTFTFYSADTGGETYLAVQQNSIPVSKGIYNVLIGSGTITPGTENTLAEVFQNHEDVWMGMKVGEDPEMTPRQRITSVAYALKAGHADSSDPQQVLDSMEGLLESRGLDADGDGRKSVLAGGVDCRDNDNSIYPGAPELCDGKDNQCPGDAGNGFVDEGCTVGEQWPVRTHDGGGSFGPQIFVYKDKYAFIVNNILQKFEIYNVSNKSSPVLIGDCCNAFESIVGASLQGDYLHTGDGRHWVTYEISVLGANTVSATMVHLDSGGLGDIMNIAVEEHYAYLLLPGSPASVTKWNIDDPANPVRKSMCGFDSDGSGPEPFYVHEGYAYRFIEGGFSRIDTYSCTEVIMELLECILEPVNSAQIIGDYAYIATWCDRIISPGVYAGFVTADVSQPSQLEISFSYELTDPGTLIQVEGNYAYILDAADRFYVYNVRNPGRPALVGAPFELPGHGLALDLSGNYAYIVGDNFFNIIQVMK